MKKRSILTAIATVLLLGITSCSKESGEKGDDSDGTGKLSITFNLPVDGPKSRAIAPSKAKPVTTWSSISRAIIIFVNPTTGIIKDAREMILPADGTGNATNVYMGVVANPTGYTAYILGNYPAAWSVATMKGRDYASFVFAPSAAASYAGSPHFDNGSTGYGEVDDIFVARQTNVIVNADTNNEFNTPFALARINSLFRARIDVITKNATTKNSVIDFAASTAMFSIRRTATSYSLVGTTNYPSSSGVLASPGAYSFANTAKKELNVFYKQDAMKDANPKKETHTNPETMLVNPITFWNEYRIFPGGSNETTVGSGKDKFDIVLSGLTKDDTYIPTGYTKPVPAGTRIFWSGQVQNAVGPNQILELNIVLESAGTTTLPEVGEYGNLTIKATLVQWGDIISSELPM